MYTLDQLLELSETIKSETIPGANTAERVGTVLKDIVDNIKLISANALPAVQNLTVAESSLTLVASMRYVNITRTSPLKVILQYGKDHVNQIHTVINSSEYDFTVDPTNDDKINNGGSVTLRAKSVMTVISCGERGWWVIN